MIAKQHEKEEARRLRGKGMAMKQIAKLLGVSPGSVHLWTKDIELTEEQKAQNKKNSMRKRSRPIVDQEGGAKSSRRQRFTYQQHIEKGTLPITSHGTRKFLIKTRGYRCEICGIEEWRGEPVPLVLDHIDGDSDNHVPNNVRMVCRNCDGLLPTYNGRNMGKGRSKSRMDYKWNTMGQHKGEENGAPGEA